MTQLANKSCCTSNLISHRLPSAFRRSPVLHTINTIEVPILRPEHRAVCASSREEDTVSHRELRLRAQLSGLQCQAVIEIDDRAPTHRRHDSQGLFTPDVAEHVAVDFEEAQGWHEERLIALDRSAEERCVTPSRQILYPAT